MARKLNLLEESDVEPDEIARLRTLLAERDG